MIKFEQAYCFDSLSRMRELDNFDDISSLSIELTRRKLTLVENLKLPKSFSTVKKIDGKDMVVVTLFSE